VRGRQCRFARQKYAVRIQLDPTRWPAGIGIDEVAKAVRGANHADWHAVGANKAHHRDQRPASRCQAYRSVVMFTAIPGHSSSLSGRRRRERQPGLNRKRAGAGHPEAARRYHTVEVSEGVQSSSDLPRRAARPVNLDVLFDVRSACASRSATCSTR
jgi:hypothetical protein